jgi:hypothetical protein
LHGGSDLGGWTAKQIHHAVLTSFQLSKSAYGLNQLRYDLRKLKGHGRLQRDGSRYAYRLTPKGVHVALLFLFFHKRPSRLTRLAIVRLFLSTILQARIQRMTEISSS